MGENDLPPAEPVVPVATVTPPVQVPKAPRTVCEFCECTLDAHGAVIKRGERAARVLDLENDLKERDKTIANLREENARLRPEPSARKSMFGFGG